MKLDMKHEHKKGCAWTCTHDGHRVPAVIGQKENGWRNNGGLCLEHLPLLKDQLWQTAFVPQEITGTLRAAVRDYVLSLWPDAEQPEAVTAPEKIGCRPVEYVYPNMIARSTDGRVGDYTLSHEQIKAIDKKLESLAPKMERKTVWRIRTKSGKVLQTFAFRRLDYFDTRDDAQEYMDKHHSLCKHQYEFVRVYADNIDELAPMEPQYAWRVWCGGHNSWSDDIPNAFVDKKSAIDAMESKGSDMDLCKYSVRRVLASDPDVEAPEVRYEVRFGNEPLTGERENKGRPTHPVCGFESRESASEWLTLRAKWAAADERRYTIHEIPA